MDLELDVDTQDDLDSDVATPSCLYTHSEGGAFFLEPPQAQSIVTSEDLDMVVDIVTHSSEYPEAEVKSAVFRLLAFVVSDLSTPVQHAMMTAILNPIFLTSMLIQRRTLRAKAHRTSYSSSVPSIVTWIDAILVRLGEAIIRLVGARPKTMGSCSTSALLKCSKFVKDEDKLRAVSHLPDEWTAFPGLLASHRVPPLSRRLILTLLFGVYIVAPALESSSTGSGSGCTASPILPNLHDPLRSYMSLRIDEERGINSSRDDDGLNPLSYAPLLERAEYAMALSLFTLSERAADTADSIERFRPHTRSNIFILLLTVLLPSSDSSEIQGPRRFSILQTLDPAHRILLDYNYGRHFVSWAWSAWDVGSARYSTVIFLTISWLYQLAHRRQVQKSEIFGDDIEDEVSQSILVKELCRDPRSACNAMRSVLQELSLSSHDDVIASAGPHTTYPSIQRVIHLASWACLHLVRADKSCQTTTFSRADLISTCRILCREVMIPTWPPRLPTKSFQALSVSYLLEMDPVSLADALDPKCPEHVEVAFVVPSISACINAVRLRASGTQDDHNNTTSMPPSSIIDLLHILKTLLEMTVLCLPYSKTLSNHMCTSRVLVSVLDWLDTLPPAHSLDFYSSQLMNALISNVALVLVGMKPTATGDKSLDLEDNYGYSILHGLIMDRGLNDLVILCAFVPTPLRISPFPLRSPLSANFVGLISIICGVDLASASLLFVSNIIRNGPSETKKMFSTLHNVEQWNYLREALLILTGHNWHCSAEDQILAELVALSICSALREKMRDLDFPARTALHFFCYFVLLWLAITLTPSPMPSLYLHGFFFLGVLVLDSPWTSSLISGLASLQDPGWGLHTGDERRMILRERLRTSASSLLVQIQEVKSGLGRLRAADSVTIPTPTRAIENSNLVYAYCSTHPGGPMRLISSRIQQ